MCGLPESWWADAPEELGWAGGDVERTGGVPNLGGETPSELERAAARAEIPGPFAPTLSTLSVPTKGVVLFELGPFMERGTGLPEFE